MKSFDHAFKALAKNAIFIYQSTLSPYFGGNCRFQPSCSEYARQAYSEHSFLKASQLVFRRLSRCHPFGSHGWDPVPLKGDLK